MVTTSTELVNLFTSLGSMHTQFFSPTVLKWWIGVDKNMKFPHTHIKWFGTFKINNKTDRYVLRFESMKHLFFILEVFIVLDLIYYTNLKKEESVAHQERRKHGHIASPSPIISRIEFYICPSPMWRGLNKFLVLLTLEFIFF